MSFLDLLFRKNKKKSVPAPIPLTLAQAIAQGYEKCIGLDELQRDLKYLDKVGTYPKVQCFLLQKVKCSVTVAELKTMVVVLMQEKIENIDHRQLNSQLKDQFVMMDKYFVAIANNLNALYRDGAVYLPTQIKVIFP